MVGFLSFVLHFLLVIHLISFACFSKLASVRVLPVLSIVRSDTLAHARRPSQTLFHEREKNHLGMGRDLPSGVGITPVDRPSNFVLFGGRLMPQQLTA